jgi:hypothetical protein
MVVRWLSAEQAVTRFVLETSLNGRDWVTRARYPKDDTPWDGRPTVSSFATSWQRSMPVSKLTGATPPADWLAKMQMASVRGDDFWFTAAYTSGLTGEDYPLASQHGNSVLVQHRALFYQPDMATRRFELTGCSPDGTVFLIDGEPVGGKLSAPKGPLTG